MNGNTNSYEIFVDASIDVVLEYIIENGVRVVPMGYMIDGESLTMEMPGTEEQMKYFYDRMRAGSITGTSQISPYTYEKHFSEAAEEGKDILYISLSSGLSNTYASSLAGAKEVMAKYPGVRIECVDSLGGTSGMWLLLSAALRGRNEGKSLEDNAAFLRSIALDVCYWFMVEDLAYLKRGGRISATAAVAGTVLNLKPILKITDEGTLVSIAKQRGIPRALKYMLDSYRGSYDDSISSEVLIANADCPERAQKVAEEILKINPKAKIGICPIGPVIGAHVGPGMLAIVHFGKRNYR